MKKLILIFALIFVAINVGAQNPFDGFLKPKSGTVPTRNMLRADGGSSAWFVRPAATLTAVQFTWDAELKSFSASTFSSAGIGIGYQHYVEKNGVIVNNYGVNALLMLDGSQDAGYAVAGTLNALQFVNFGAGYNFTGKRFFLVTGAVWNF